MKHKLIGLLLISTVLSACSFTPTWSEWAKRPTDGMACRYTRKPIKGKYYLECRLELKVPELDIKE